jgi:hypothetical protein
VPDSCISDMDRLGACIPPCQFPMLTSLGACDTAALSVLEFLCSRSPCFSTSSSVKARPLVEGSISLGAPGCNLLGLRSRRGTPGARAVMNRGRGQTRSEWCGDAFA